jgi:hypothetical protein
MEIVSIEDLKKGDIILTDGFNDNELFVLTVSKITEDGLIIPKELGGMDYCPEDPEQIVRLGRSKTKLKFIIS